jgi:hypothetical protein
MKNITHDLKNRKFYMKLDKALLKTDLIKAIKITGTEIEPNQIKILVWGRPQKPKSLEKEKMAVYIFFHKKECLKVGKVGPNSNPRYESHHYNPNYKGSSLLNSLLKDKDSKKYIGRCKDIGNWIKKNTRRINILLDKRLGMFVLNFVEAYFQVKFKPRYEGSKSKNT